MAYPKNYRYTKEHEWISMAGGLATIGITDYAQHETGRRGLRRTAQPRSENRTGEKSFGTVESVKGPSARFTRPAGGRGDRSQWRTPEIRPRKSIAIRTARRGLIKVRLTKRR